MNSATVTFFRANGTVNMTLCIAGKVIAISSSQESILRELQIHGVRYVTIDEVFSTELPTSETTLKLAAGVNFSEPLAALKLIAACSSMGDVWSLPFFERRLGPKSELPSSDASQA